ncbi:enoyl-CoA hydratase-related protein [Alicyclobacillus dauci]|uniref:Enoyl-CoA hydratase-related protein n=1 Tax=Alicyclobacillus dauci TaxID=1475485 RepID=A0ABY6Z1V2_9BACL|nr:enoyl-CoA hydratase-related protein [Alicyclobacillus dauci]WAH36191.1 enoyl-CoA hydratase-related protein [Alicyclobacillus dauci]
MESKDQAILFEKKEDIVTLTLNRPNILNAINLDITVQMEQCLSRAELDEDVRVIILTGNGRSFCTGADLKEVSRGVDLSNECGGGFAGLVRSKTAKPLIAAVNGLAYGGGFEIALACDVIIAARGAQFALPEVKRGLIASGGGLLRLPRHLPIKVACFMAFTGLPLSAEQLMHWGVVNQVVDSEKLMDSAYELAAVIAENAPLAVKATKQLLMSGTELPMYTSDEAWQMNNELGRMIANSYDAKEGSTAYVERRSPVWKGR